MACDDSDALSRSSEELFHAWQQYKSSTVKHFHDGLDFGKKCYEWREQYRAQGSRLGTGFERVLEQLHIPKTTAYRWMNYYADKEGLRAARYEVPRKRERVHKGPSLKAISFRMFLEADQRRQFAADVQLLGGRTTVSSMFVRFVNEKAEEHRRREYSNVRLLPRLIVDSREFLTQRIGRP